ncbi:MAG: hypothetical protein ACKVT2_03520 [Saprospiraceae bacterium]
MTNTNLLEVIKVLHISKRQEFGLFLTSSLFNRARNAQEIVCLYKIILAAAPDFSKETLEKEGVYFKVFSEGTIEPRRLERLISELSKLLQTYILIDQYLLETTFEAQQINWARWLRVNGLAMDSRKVLLKLKNKSDYRQTESLERYRSDFLAAEEEHEWKSMDNQFSGDIGILQLMDSLDLFYYNYRIELENRYLVQQTGAHLPDLEAKQNGLGYYQGESVLLQISQKINDFLREKLRSADELRALVKFLHENEDAFPFQTLVQFYTYLRNACTVLINNGSFDLVPVLLEIYKDNFERGHFYTNGEITSTLYLNLVHLATRAKEFDWARQFAESHKGRIVGGDPGKFFYLFNLSLCFFSEGYFEQALNSLPEAPSSSHYHHMVRRLELKILYELQSDLLLYKIDAFRKFIMRTAIKTIAANLRTMDLNFLNILTQLSQSPLKDKARSARLLSRIDGKKLLADRPWLIEKAKELG